MSDSTAAAGATAPVVSVRGEARLECPPDLAVLSVTVTARAHQAAACSELLAGRLAEVRAITEASASGLEKSEQGAISLWPEYREGSTEKIERYVAQATIEVEVNDFSVLPDLVGALGGIELLQVAGPWWRLRHDNPAYQRARVAAAEDAQTRARDYAAAFGAELVELLEVADQGMSTSGAASARGVQLMAKADFALGSPQDAVFDFSPVPQEVFGALEARFAMSPVRMAHPAN